MLYTVDDNRKFPFSTVGIFSIFVAVWMGKMSNLFSLLLVKIRMKYLWMKILSEICQFRFANQLTISNKGLAM